jgi:hypothetical protein
MRQPYDLVGDRCDDPSGNCRHDLGGSPCCQPIEETTMATTDTRTEDTLLRTALGANAIFSGVSGIVLALGAAWIGDLTGIPVPALVVVGVGLVGYALLLRRFATRTVLRPDEARTAIAGDVAWVIGSVGLLLLGRSLFTTTGLVILVVVVALVVADFAIAQTIELRRIQG